MAVARCFTVAGAAPDSRSVCRSPDSLFVASSRTVAPPYVGGTTIALSTYCVRGSELDPKTAVSRAARGVIAEQHLVVLVERVLDAPVHLELRARRIRQREIEHLVVIERDVADIDRVPRQPVVREHAEAVVGRRIADADIADAPRPPEPLLVRRVLRL